ncbi:guanine nucleotide-releasing factor 2-like [Limulus polyphemus]|uniref:Guanine nucleotide-releasing factor 2-like n=1 Tax=Limulus polyphemus TaxID=6850 RepID=A0ABM1BME9_LIMPO|nr:guanine nucleotide-releasing factor 2-like [Limulus polyphemus]
MSAKRNKTDLTFIRDGKLSRQARSFKEDFFGKIVPKKNLLSPKKNSKLRGKRVERNSEKKVIKSRIENEIEDLYSDAQHLKNALRYVQEVVEKKKTLEVLPGSANVVLETVLSIQLKLSRLFDNDQCLVVSSSFKEVYKTLANLVKWSDNALYISNSYILATNNVDDIINQLQEAVDGLVKLSVGILSNTDNNLNQVFTSSLKNSNIPDNFHGKSLLDIPSTSREKGTLENIKVPNLSQCSPSFQTSVSNYSIFPDDVLHSSILQMKEDIQPPISLGMNSNSQYCILQPQLTDLVSSLPPKQCNTDIVVSSEPHTEHPKSLVQKHKFYSYSTSSASTFGTSTAGKTETTSVGFPNWHSPDDFFPLSPVAKLVDSSIDTNHQCSTNDSLTMSSSRSFMYSQKAKDVSIHRSEISHTKSYRYLSTSFKTPNSKDLGIMMEQHVSCISKESKQTNHIISSGLGSMNIDLEHPAVLSDKQGTESNCERQSHYDNKASCNFLFVEKNGFGTVSNSMLSEAHSSQSVIDHKNWVDTSHKHSCSFHKIKCTSEVSEPSPLPMKKKNIVAYMQMLGSYQPDEKDFFYHSNYTFHAIETRWQKQNAILTHPQFFKTAQASSSDDSVISDGQSSLSSFGEETETASPAMPPKRSAFLQASILELEKTCSEVGDKGTSLEIEKQNLPISSMDETESNILDRQDVSSYIVWKKPNEEGPEIRGGPVDALIVQASKAGKKSFLYQEAFLTTYRTIISPVELIDKLIYRFNKFIHMTDTKERAARNAFSLLVRVADDLCGSDIEDGVLQKISDFVHQLVSTGELTFARILRKKIVEKCEVYRFSQQSLQVLLTSLNVTTCSASLLDFKSEVLAEQMTLLDAELFQKIEFPEVLLWVKEQKEDLSPNLTSFTEHFNKMSYWVRSRILEQNDAREREKYVSRFIRILKHLRKLNNFNSYLAVLSALDSAPIRRLEWQKNITEALKEYCALIDSSSSFRAYRQALANTEPPCIPYIGLILQDLTFVHVGNSDFLPDGNVNFSKRWQQFNILEKMRRFKKPSYPFKRNEQVINSFGKFNDHLCEEAMWQISETIKPRGGQK